MIDDRVPVADTMSGSDALLWTVGRDPVLRPTVVAAMVLDKAPGWADIPTRVGAGTLKSRSRRTPMHTGAIGIPEGATRHDERGRPCTDDLPVEIGSRPDPVPKLRRRVRLTSFDESVPIWMDAPIWEPTATSPPRVNGGSVS